MKVVILSAGSSVHTIRWVNGLSRAGIDVHLISQHPLLETLSPEIKVHLFPFRGAIGYFTMVPAVKRLLQQIKPDLINAHFASGYGTTGRLLGFHPWILSVWGSDVYSFPKKSILHKKWVVANLLAADGVVSTSHCMATQTRGLSPRLGKIDVVPFGVDLDVFQRIETTPKTKDATFVIGTVKSMSPVYGIDVLLRSFGIAYERLVTKDPTWADKLVLRLIGGGSHADAYKQLSKDLGIEHITDFVGVVSHSAVPGELEKMDVFAALSREESFGVAVIEANAAGLPVIVSDAEGLQEVVVNGQTGVVVPKENTAAAADAIIELVLDSERRVRLGTQGRRHVAANYSWSSSVQKLIRVFQQTTLERH